MNANPKILLPVSILLAAGTTVASLAGILIPGLYAAETMNWQIQAKAQDITDLALVMPLLVLFSFKASRGNLIFLSLWGGCITYLLYTFIIYAFGVHFNKMFPVYCLNLGLAFYSFLYFLFIAVKRHPELKLSAAHVRRFISLFFISIAIMFYGLWILEILPAISSGYLPASIMDTGLPTNPVHVIDLSVFLPGVFITGLLLWTGNRTGILLARSILVFFILMNITIATIQYMLYNADLAREFQLAYIMLGLAALSLTLLIWINKKSDQHPAYAA